MKILFCTPYLAGEGIVLSGIGVWANNILDYYNTINSDVGGIPDMIDNYHNGILCEPKIDDIADKIIGLLNNEALCEKLGRSALTDSQKFSAELMAERYVSIYSDGSVL